MEVAAFVAGFVLVTLLFGVAITRGVARVRRSRRWVKATFVALAVLCAGGALYVVSDWANGPEFDAQAWRETHVAQDYDRLEPLARDAVESDVLLGKDRREVRRLMGQPDRTGKARPLWIWELGFIGDYIGPGDAGALYVQFDPATDRVTKTVVDTSAPSA